VRTPLQIAASVTVACSSFALPWALATVRPHLDVSPRIEPVLQELEVIVLVLPETPSAEAPDHEAAAEAPRKAQAEVRETGPEDVLESTAPVQTDDPHPGSVWASVALDHHVRPDRSLASSRRRHHRRARQCAEPTPGITRTGAGRYDLDQDLVDHYARHPREAEKLARSAWHRGPSGEVDGFRLWRVRCGTPLHQLGLRNGDVVHEVGGRTVTSIPQALRAWRKLRRNERLKVIVTDRKGGRKVLRYRVT